MIKITKTPIIKTGTMVYFKDDPDKTPYRWRIWDDIEKIVDNDIKFCNPKDAKYFYTIEFRWKITI